MDNWDEGLRKLWNRGYGIAPKDPIPRSSEPETEMLELDGIFFAETMIYDLSYGSH